MLKKAMDKPSIEPVLAVVLLTGKRWADFDEETGSRWWTGSKASDFDEAATLAQQLGGTNEDLEIDDDVDGEGRDYRMTVYVPKDKAAELLALSAVDGEVVDEIHPTRCGCEDCE